MRNDLLSKYLSLLQIIQIHLHLEKEILFTTIT